MSAAAIPGKATAVAPSNIAFIKYWGARDLERGVPANASLSMTLSRCVSRSTVELMPAGAADEVLLVDAEGRAEPAPVGFTSGVRRHLSRLRERFGRDETFRVGTRNSFPAGAGLASSASGFAALTLAVVRALGREVRLQELSRLARLSGSGSAARSVTGGYVELVPVEEGSSAATRLEELAPAGHWDLRDVVAVVETEPKEVSSREGHRRARTSPYFAARLEELPRRLETVRRGIRRRDLDALGPVLEEEAVDMHLVAMSSRPPIFYWKPATLEVWETVRDLRSEGVSAYFTMDAGANVHVICEAEDEPRVADRLGALECVRRVIRDGVGSGPNLEDSHLL